MKTSGRLAVLTLAAGVVSLLPSAPAAVASGTAGTTGRTGRDVAVVSVATDHRAVAAGQAVTVTVLSVNHGRGPLDQAVAVADVAGLTAESAGCAWGVSPDGPNICEYGAPPAGRRFTTTFVLRAAASRHSRSATVRACTTNLAGGADPAPRNDCRSVTVTIAGRR